MTRRWTIVYELPYFPDSICKALSPSYTNMDKIRCRLPILEEIYNSGAASTELFVDAIEAAGVFLQ